MRWLSVAAMLVVGVPVLLVGAGQLGWLAGRMPPDLGVQDGRLKAPSKTDNSVSSQADLWAGLAHRDAARVAPLPLVGDGPATIARLRDIALAMPGASVLAERPDYLHVAFRSRWLGFVDDAEFWVDPSAGVVQVRSAARVGRRDFGVNRARVEAIRARLAAP